MSGAAKMTVTACALLGAFALAACTSSQSEIETGAAQLPSPKIVIVTDFAASRPA